MIKKQNIEITIIILKQKIEITIVKLAKCIWHPHPPPHRDTTKNYSVQSVSSVWEQWLTPVIPALWKGQGMRITWGQKLKTSLANMVKPHFH